MAEMNERLEKETGKSRIGKIEKVDLGGSIKRETIWIRA
jgi:hypothetical protein